MPLTSIADQKTPGRPVEITFAAETGLPSANQEVLLFGRKDASSGTISPYEVTVIANSGDEVAGLAEAELKFGAGSELALMVLAAIKANRGKSSLPQLKCVPLTSSDADFGAADIALTNAQKVKAEFIVSPFDGMDLALGGKLKDHCLLVSGAQRVENNQYGSIGVVFNRDTVDPSTLHKYDTQYLSPVYLRDSGSPSYSIGEMAAAFGARMAGNTAPFNPLDDDVIVGIDAPALESDFLSVGQGLESESVLNQGWTPARVFPNLDVAFVRTVTARLSADGSGTPVVGAYYDVQDFQVLYFYRKTIFTRWSQPDLKKRKASENTGNLLLSEVIRLATTFEDQQMFQAVSQLAKQFQVERSLTDRHRFDVKVPVNVVPGLHVIATNIEATTEFDTFSV